LFSYNRAIISCYEVYSVKCTIMFIHYSKYKLTNLSRVRFFYDTRLKWIRLIDCIMKCGLIKWPIIINCSNFILIIGLYIKTFVNDSTCWILASIHCCYCSFKIWEQYNPFSHLNRLTDRPSRGRLLWNTVHAKLSIQRLAAVNSVRASSIAYWYRRRHTKPMHSRPANRSASVISLCTNISKRAMAFHFLHAENLFIVEWHVTPQRKRPIHTSSVIYITWRQAI